MKLVGKVSIYEHFVDNRTCTAQIHSLYTEMTYWTVTHKCKGYTLIHATAFIFIFTEIPKLQEFLQELNDCHSETLNYVSGAYGILSLIQGARSRNMVR